MIPKMITNKKTIILKTYLVCFILFSLYSLSAISQEALILTVNGDKINGTIENTEISVKTESGVVKVLLKDIALIDLVSSAKQVSAKAYLHLLRGRQFQKEGDNDTALAEFRLAVAASPDYTDANYELANLLEKMGRKSEANEYMSRVIAVDPMRPGIEDHLKDMGDGYLNKKDFSKAAETYSLLFQKYPQNKNAEFAVFKAGFLYAWELRDNKKAISVLESAVKTYPDDQNVPKALYEIGRLYTEEGNLESAEKAFMQLITKYPSEERADNAHYSLASIYYQKRQYDKATQEIKTILNESTDQALIASAKKLVDEFAWNVYTVADKLPTDDVHTIIRDKDYIWVGTASGVIQFDLASDSFTGEVILPNTKITALAVDESSLWIGTSNSWLVQYDKTKGSLEQDSFLKVENVDKVLSLSADKVNVWVGTESGIYQYDKQKRNWKHYTTNDGLPDNTIASLASTSNGVWCGTMKNGIAIFDYSTLKWKSLNTQSGLSGRAVPVIAYCGSQVWFAWYEDFKNGISGYDPGTGSWKEWPISEWEADVGSDQQGDNTQHVTSSMISLGAGEKEAWVGTESVAIFYNCQTSNWSQPFNYPTKLTGSAPSCIAVDSEYVWFATPHGLGRLNKKLANDIKTQNIAGSGE